MYYAEGDDLTDYEDDHEDRLREAIRDVLRAEPGLNASWAIDRVARAMEKMDGWTAETDSPRHAYPSRLRYRAPRAPGYRACIERKMIYCYVREEQETFARTA